MAIIKDSTQVPLVNKTLCFKNPMRQWVFRYIFALIIVFILINTLVRFFLAGIFSDNLPLSSALFAGSAAGLINDLAALCYVIVLPATLILLPSSTFYTKRAGRAYAVTILFIYCAVLIFTAFAEVYFWDEFNSRFNFIAVDYLLYTTEVLQNMLESYPILPLFLAIGALSSGVTALLWLGICRRQSDLQHGRQLDSQPALTQPALPFSKRVATLGSLYAVATIVFWIFTPIVLSSDRFINEYAKDGVYELFSAYSNNQLDYKTFYKTLKDDTAFHTMRQELSEKNTHFLSTEENDLIRLVDSAPQQKKPNVVLVIMESMGKDLRGKNTPNLNALAEKGIDFTDMSSTGTRTVRGIEAIMLSIPPTPGNSIVRRPDNDNLYSLGTVFKEQGYMQSFIYGGVGFFDNMNAFFSGNGFQVIDKLSFTPQNKTFATAWGQCDEDLYHESLMQADINHQKGKPFLQVLLTTSNHRPYTYPDGKVAIPSGESRKGAVSYADYAIGEYIKEAQGKPWFDNTVFIFVGDHPASIAGKTELPADKYGIVCTFYAPKMFAAKTVTSLCSQIDIAPTLFSLLGWDYRSQFFGEDALTFTEKNGRAWISTYQLLGYRDMNTLVVLSPDGKSRISNIEDKKKATLMGEESSLQTLPDEKKFQEKDLEQKTIASYQTAADLFTSKKMKEDFVYARTDNKPKESYALQQTVDHKAEGKPPVFKTMQEKRGVIAHVLLGLNGH